MIKRKTFKNSNFFLRLIWVLNLFSPYNLTIVQSNGTVFVKYFNLIPGDTRFEAFLKIYCTFVCCKSTSIQYSIRMNTIRSTFNQKWFDGEIFKFDFLS